MNGLVKARKEIAMLRALRHVVTVTAANAPVVRTKVSTKLTPRYPVNENRKPYPYNWSGCYIFNRFNLMIMLMPLSNECDVFVSIYLITDSNCSENLSRENKSCS